jgi:hypothetical protein
MISKNYRVVVTGSSVAAGYYATDLKGWAFLMGKELKRQRSDVSVSNVAIPGANTEQTIRRFRFAVAPLQPDVIVGLSLMNEGLLWMKPEDAYASFKNGLLKLIEMIRDINATPMLGGVYPCNFYTEEHYSYLKRMDEDMKGWGVPVFDFLSALDDGQGQQCPPFSFSQTNKQ